MVNPNVTLTNGRVIPKLLFEKVIATLFQVYAIDQPHRGLQTDWIGYNAVSSLIEFCKNPENKIIGLDLEILNGALLCDENGNVHKDIIEIVLSLLDENGQIKFPSFYM